MLSWIFLILGITMLLIGGNFLLFSSVKLAKKLKLSTLVIGMTVVSFATSAPELIVSLKSAWLGHPNIAVGNIIGSNIANLGLVLGVTSIFIPIGISSFFFKRDWIWCTFSTFILIFALINGQISRTEGLICVLFLILFVIHLIYSEKQNSLKLNNDKTHSLWILFIALIMGSGLLWIGSGLLVSSTVEIAIKFGIKERVLANSLIAFGTSIPELVISLLAALRKEVNISIGNLLGSNVFNVFAVIGLTSLVHPMTNLDTDIWQLDIWLMLGVTILVAILVMLPKQMKINSWKGIVLLGLYLIFIWLLYK